MKNLFKTENHWTGLVARLVLGIVMLAHGLQMGLGMVGGYGFEGTMNYLTQTERLPWIIAFATIAITLVGSIGLLLGLAARLWAVGFIAVMVGAILTVHLPFGFFMNWNGTAKGEGMEYHFLAIGLSLIILFNGGGRYSIDHAIQRN